MLGSGPCRRPDQTKTSMPPSPINENHDEPISVARRTTSNWSLFKRLAWFSRLTLGTPISLAPKEAWLVLGFFVLIRSYLVLVTKKTPLHARNQSEKRRAEIRTPSVVRQGQGKTTNNAHRRRPAKSRTRTHFPIISVMNTNTNN